jgi:hypothetical protein
MYTAVVTEDVGAAERTLGQITDAAFRGRIEHLMVSGTD